MMKKEKEVITVQIVVKSYLIQLLNMKVVQVGLRFINHFQMHSKLKQTLYWDMKELSIIAKNVVGIMVTSLKMDLSQQVKGIVIMVFV